MTGPEPFTVTVPNMPGQPADHYEGPTLPCPFPPAGHKHYDRAGIENHAADLEVTDFPYNEYDLHTMSEGFDTLERTGGF